jgi:4-amino-4-deoxy-L-arabinose transferase-like glycosyltransferase
MGSIKKYAPILAPLLIAATFFLTRFVHILNLPIFTDEAIYIRWSQIAANDASWRFISLTDGKQPMYVWVTMILLKLIHDPLLAGRTTSVIAGFLSLIGMYFLTAEIFKNKKIGLLASFIYAIYPFALVYDRVAVYDSLVAMFIIWSLYLEVLLARHVRLDLAMILGMVIGGGMLTKTSDDFALALLPISLIFFNYADKKWRKKLRDWIIYAVVVGIIAELMYLILRLSPFYYIINQKNATFVYPIKEWVHHPFTYFISNISALLNWLTGYATIPFLVLVIASFFVGKKFFREKLFLLIAFLAPFIYLAFFGRTIYPRFILFMTMPLLVLGADSLYYMVKFVKQFWLKALVVIVFLLMFVINDFFIITNFAQANIPQSDKGQFVTGWPGGVGVMESINFFKQQADQQKIYIGTEGTFGLMPYALEIYLKDNPNMTIKGFWPIGDTPPTEAIAASKKMPTYFVFYQDCPACQGTGVVPVQWKVKQVMQFSRIDKNSYYTVYQLLP